MLLKGENEKRDGLENWPLHFYALRDGKERERLLLLRLETEGADIEIEKRRLRLLKERYGDPIPEKGRIRDGYIASWMSLLISGRGGVSFFNRKRVEKEVRGALEGFGLLKESPDALQLEEWRAFAGLWIETCVQDRSYGSTAFGLFRMKEETLARKIAEEIEEVCRRIPEKFQLEKECEPLYRIMRESFCRRIQNGEEIYRGL